MRELYGKNYSAERKKLLKKFQYHGLDYLERDHNTVCRLFMLVLLTVFLFLKLLELKGLYLLQQC